MKTDNLVFICLPLYGISNCLRCSLPDSITVLNCCWVVPHVHAYVYRRILWQTTQNVNLFCLLSFLLQIIHCRLGSDSGNPVCISLQSMSASRRGCSLQPECYVSLWFLQSNPEVQRGVPHSMWLVFDHNCQCLPHCTICTCLTDISSGDNVVTFSSINRLVFRHVLQSVEMCMSCFMHALWSTHSTLPHFSACLADASKIFHQSLLLEGSCLLNQGIDLAVVVESCYFHKCNHTPLFFHVFLMLQHLVISGTRGHIWNLAHS